MRPQQMKAAQACEECRKMKRKCSRDLPRCALCARLDKGCTYVKYFAADQDAVANLTKSVAHGSEQSQPFPSAFFLDRPSLSPLEDQQLSQNVSPIHPGICTPLLQETDAICATYFATTHTWLPILSESHFRRDLQSSANKSRPRDALLLLCMKLSSMTASELSVPYPTAQKICAVAANDGSVSLRLIQSLVLLAVYEMEHTMYPAAYLTIGTAARLAVMLGLRIKKQSLPRVATLEVWRLQEEQRRVWWALFLLDRIIVVGNPELPFAVPDPTSSDMLPANDSDWSQGRMGVNEAFLSLQSHLIPVDGSFSKTVQSAYMLGKVLRHISPESQDEMSTADRLDEAMQMSTVLRAMNRCFEESLPHEGLQRPTSWNCKVNAMSLCATARMLLYSHHMAHGSDTEDALRGTEMTREATQGILYLTTSTIPILVDMIRQSPAVCIQLSSGQSRPAASVPVLAQFLYQACKLLAWQLRERPDAHLRQQLREAVRCLHTIGDFWRIGESYLELLGQNKVLELVGWGGKP